MTNQIHAFDQKFLTDEPCPVCRELAESGELRREGVMPLPKCPPRLRLDNRQCCYDCQAAETTQMFGNNPLFSAARVAIANERIEGLRMPAGMMLHFGLCKMGYVRPCSFDDLAAHQAWLEKHGIDFLEEVEDHT